MTPPNNSISPQNDKLKRNLTNILGEKGDAEFVTKGSKYKLKEEEHKDPLELKLNKL